MYIKVMLTLLVVATAILAIVVARPAPAPAVVLAPNQLEAVLTRTIDSIEMYDMPIDAAVRVLHEKSGADIRVAWQSFAKADTPLQRTQHVTLLLQHITLAEALRAVFNFNYSQYVFLNASGNVIDVSAGGPHNGQLTVRVYDVRDLVSDQYWGVSIPTAEQTAAQDQRMSDLKSILSTYASHAEMDLFTGVPRDASYESVGGRLIVTQTLLGHEKVVNVLAWLRKLR